jgi:hypothetical protein
VDLIGDQSVQVVTAVLKAAILLASAMLALLLTARLSRTAKTPLVATPQQFVTPYLCPDAHDSVSALLARCLPVRAPPDLSRRNSLSSSGAPASQ